MDQFLILPVDRSYNTEMIAIIRSAPIIAGGLSLYFDKSPDIFKISELKYSESKHMGFFHGNKLVGFASLGYQDAIIHRKPQKVFTFYHFYILPEARGRHLPERTARLFLDDVSGKAKYGYFVTLKGNHQVESLVTRQNYPWSPPYGITNELVVKSILFSLPHRNKTNFKIRNAEIDDIPEIVKLLNAEQGSRDFGRLYDEAGFQDSLVKRGLSIENYFLAESKKGDIKGVCLAWDCSSFRKTVLENISTKFYPLLISYKTLEKILPMTPFPVRGESFRELTITDYAAENREISVMHALLSEIYFRNLNRRYHFMNFASCTGDDLLKAAKGFWHHDIVSNIIFFNNDPEKSNMSLNLPYIDIAFL